MTQRAQSHAYGNFHSSEHPIWPIIRLIVIMSALTLVLWLNAANFDETELKVIGWMFLAILGRETFTPILTKVKDVVSKENNSND